VKRVLFALAIAIPLACAAQSSEVAIAPFSSAAAGDEIPAGWETVTLPYGRKNEFRIVPEGHSRVLQVRSEDAFGSLAFRLSAEAARTPMLTWRWKIDRVVDKADMETKEGEDFAARVYVAFDFPTEQLSGTERAKLKIARAVEGFVPAAAICYVWDNKHAQGSAVFSPHFAHVRTVVVQTGNDRAGQWLSESRDVEADFVAAFGESWKGHVPNITGVVVGNDTDQTAETVTAWFGDIQLGPRK